MVVVVLVVVVVVGLVGVVVVGVVVVGGVQVGRPGMKPTAMCTSTWLRARLRSPKPLSRTYNLKEQKPAKWPVRT